MNRFINIVCIVCLACCCHPVMANGVFSYFYNNNNYLVSVQVTEWSGASYRVDAAPKSWTKFETDIGNKAWSQGITDMAITTPASGGSLNHFMPGGYVDAFAHTAEFLINGSSIIAVRYDH